MGRPMIVGVSENGSSGTSGFECFRSAPAESAHTSEHNVPKYTASSDNGWGDR